MNKKQKKILVRIIITSVLYLLLELLRIEGISQIIGYLIAYLIIGYDILRKAIKGIFNRQLLDENFLMIIATIGAIVLKDYSEAVSVMLFYQIGEFFQAYAIEKSRKSIIDLMDIRPEYANVERNNSFEKVNPEEVKIDEVILVKVGEKIPLDGIIIEGESSLNTSSLTGESTPRDVIVNDEVISGCINMTSLLRIRVTKEYSDSTVSKVLDLIENASSNKAKSEDFISKFAKYYTPIVCSLALFLALIIPLFNIISGNAANFSDWIYRSFTFLVISCPCALVVSIPLSFFAGIGKASREGILIKGSNYLEDFAKVKYLLLDKTGTITKGVFEVDGIHHNLISDDELLEYAAHAEIFSIHPIAESLKKAYGKPLNKEIVESVKEYSGGGIKAIIKGKEILLGNEKLMHDNGIEIIKCHHVGTIVHIAINHEYYGHFLINDLIKQNSKKTISILRKYGIKEIVMLTGDLEKIALSVKEKLNIDTVYSELLPSDKVNYLIEYINKKNKNEKVAFVGDGINDTPALARADVGISMGALGSDAAIEAADIVLMDDDPIKIAKLMKISKKCMRIVYENIFFAIFVKVICLILGAFGITNMWLAIFADVGVMIIAVLNAIRILI